MIEFRFGHPWVWWIALGVGAVYVFLLVRRWRQGEALPSLIYSDTRLILGAGRGGWRARLVHLPDVLRVIAWVMLVVALARPQFGQAREVLRGQGIDIVIALDISGSMAALDFQPVNRLEAAKGVIADFIDQREFDRIGIVVFARSAFHQAPLTLDYPVLTRLLQDVRLVTDVVDDRGNMLLLDGTAIGLGLLSSALMLRDSDAPSRVIILLTDGENNAGIDPLTAADALATLGIRVYTIAVGRTGQIPVPLLDGSILFVESELNEDVLREIARVTDGEFFRAEDTDQLREIYNAIDALERSPVERRVFVPWQDQAWGWIAAALAFLLIERVLRWTLFQTLP